MYKLIGLSAVALMTSGPIWAQSADDEELRSLTSNVLASINGTTVEPVATAEVETEALQELVQQALSEGQSDSYLEALIDEAVDGGQIEVPDAMRTTTGDVDRRTLLASLVAQSAGAQSTDTDQIAAEGADTNERFYEVVAGDSLAAISLIYYGTTQSYDKIFEANRDSLRSPDRIQVGQILLIPE